MPTVILTRSHRENSRIAPLFESRGFAVRSAPMIELRRITSVPPDLFELSGDATVLLTSAFATGIWLDLRGTLPVPPAAYLVVGRRSAKLLTESDPDVPIVAVADSAAELLQRIPERHGRILYPCSAERRDETVDELRSREIELVEIPLYSPTLPEHAAETLADATSNAPPPIVFAFFSPSAARNFFSLNPVIPSNAIFAAIGRTTAEALREHGAERVIVPGIPESETLAETIRTFVMA